MNTLDLENMRNPSRRAGRLSSWLVVSVLLVAPAALGGHRPADLDVVVDGNSRQKLVHNGITYVEALRGREYALRLTNPTGERVGVALSVDGLNTIDAKHTSGFAAAKWVLAPYETIEIEGWQVSDRAARRFVFTGERASYGASLGETENLGVIEAVFYRERRRPVARYQPSLERQGSSRDNSAAKAAPAPTAAAEAQSALSDDYAATGMGGRTRHEVRRVSLDLDPQPIASVRIRYEFRPQLVKLGVISSVRSPLERRESARGFEFCPER
ncbi:MAG TPA: hypothetical protein VF701_16440 [Thermoanaerobaculia bacterium]